MKRSRILILIVVLVLVVAAVVWWARGSSDTPPAPATPAAAAAPANPVLTVATVTPTSLSLPLSLPANGNVAAWQEAIVGAEANGLRLKEVRVNVGDVVKAGQVLATFADDTVRADLAQARANLAEAQASAADAEGNAQRAGTLRQTGALSEQQINQYLTTAETAKARVASMRAAVDTQTVRLRQTQVLAPDNGVISARTATVGAVVSVGAELFRMVRQGRLEWRAEVTATELGRVSIGTLARVTAPNGVQVEGKVRMVAPTVDPQTRNALVYVDLPAMDTARGASAPVRPGMFARGEFLLGESKALAVPQAAVLLRDGFSYVFVLRDREGGTAKVAQLKVDTGRRLGEHVEIVTDLDPAAQIVARGAAFLTDGDVVRVTDAPPATGKPASAPDVK